MKKFDQIRPERFVQEVVNPFIACHYGTTLDMVPIGLQDQLTYVLEEVMYAASNPEAGFSELTDQADPSSNLEIE